MTAESLVDLTARHPGLRLHDHWRRSGFATAAIPALTDSELLFQLPEEIGFTGFLQHHWGDQFSPLKVTTYVAFMRAVLAPAGSLRRRRVGVEQLMSAPIILTHGRFGQRPAPTDR